MLFRSIEEQSIEVDVFNNRVEKIGTKHITASHRSGFLSKWIKRPAATGKFPPFGSAISVKADNADRRDRIAKGFLASLMCKGNDFQNQNYTAFLSGPYVSAGALSVTSDNFEQAMVVHAVRRIPKATWLNDRDQFMQPQGELTEDFIVDCTVWNLFSNSNQTAALRNVMYEENTYQVNNHFFPFCAAEVRMWTVTDRDIGLMLVKADDRFAAHWLNSHTLTVEAQEVLDAGRKVYQFYFANLNQLRTPQFKIETWDAGWWQIKQALDDVSLGAKELKTLKEVHEKLKAKLLPQIKAFGCIE